MKISQHFRMDNISSESLLNAVSKIYLFMRSKLAFRRNLQKCDSISTCSLRKMLLSIGQSSTTSIKLLEWHFELCCVFDEFPAKISLPQLQPTQALRLSIISLIVTRVILAELHGSGDYFVELLIYYNQWLLSANVINYIINCWRRNHN